MRVVDLLAIYGTCFDHLRRSAACGDAIAQTIQDGASPRGGDRVSFLLVEMKGFRTCRPSHLKAPGLMEDVREVEQHIRAVVEEVRLLGEADRVTR
jgi:hypothetical protein